MESPDKGQFILYQPPDGESKIEVTLSGETVWLSIDQILNHAGTISAEVAKLKANSEYDKYKERRLEQLSQTDSQYIENLEKEKKKLEK